LGLRGVFINNKETIFQKKKGGKVETMLQPLLYWKN
jgi:hypothetical protein